MRNVESLVALKSNEPGWQRRGERLGGLGLADSCLALQQERLLQGEREVDRRREPALRQIACAPQRVLQLVDRRECHPLNITASRGRFTADEVCAARSNGDTIGHGSSSLIRRGQVTPTSLDAAELVVPVSPEDAIAAFVDSANVTVVGGGTIVMPEINYGRLRPTRALFLRDAGLGGLRRHGSTLTIGAMTTIAEVEDAPEPL